MAIKTVSKAQLRKPRVVQAPEPEPEPQRVVEEPEIEGEKHRWAQEITTVFTLDGSTQL